MRQAINTLESTYQGFGAINEENVLKVVDEPHPMIIKRIIDACAVGNLQSALDQLHVLWGKGFATEDIINQVQKIVAVHGDLSEDMQLAFMNATGQSHLRIAMGCNQSMLQLSGLLATFVSIQQNLVNKF